MSPGAPNRQNNWKSNSTNESQKAAEKRKATCCRVKPDFEKFNQNTKSKHRKSERLQKVFMIREIAKTWPRPNQTAEAEVIKTANPKEKRLDKKYTNLSFAFMVS